MGGMVAAPTQETDQPDITVDIHAVIYIFNPPDRDKLGKGAAAAAAPPAVPTAAVPRQTAGASARRPARHTTCRTAGQAADRPAGQAPAGPACPPCQNPGEMSHEGQTTIGCQEHPGVSGWERREDRLRRGGLAVSADGLQRRRRHEGGHRKPEQLVQAVLKGEQAIKESPREVDLPVKDYPALAKQTRLPIAEPPYVTTAEMDPAAVGAAQPAGDAGVVQGPGDRGRSGSGAHDHRGDPGGSRARRGPGCRGRETGRKTGRGAPGRAVPIILAGWRAGWRRRSTSPASNGGLS